MKKIIALLLVSLITLFGVLPMASATDTEPPSSTEETVSESASGSSTSVESTTSEHADFDEMMASITDEFGNINWQKAPFHYMIIYFIVRFAAIFTDFFRKMYGAVVGAFQ